MSRFPKTQQGYTCGVGVGLVWCLTRRKGALHTSVLRRFSIPAKVLVVVRRIVLFLFASGGCFVPPPSAAERTLIPGQVIFFFKLVLLILREKFVNKQQDKCSFCWCPVLLNISVYSVSHHWAELRCKGAVEV